MALSTGNRNISATRHSAPRSIPADVPKVFVAVLSRLLQGNAYESIADLLEDAKRSCARSRIPYDSDSLMRAVRWMWAQRRGGLVAMPKVLEREPARRAPVAAATGLGRGDAARLLASMGVVVRGIR